MNKYSEEILSKCLARLAYDRDTGSFTWISRPQSDFVLEKEWKRWETLRAGRRAGGKQRTARGAPSHVSISIDGWPYAAHRIAWLMEHGSVPEGVFIDHINGDPWDNRIANLRLSSNKENQWNRLAPSNSTSGVKGVTWSAARNMWKSTIRMNGDYMHLGYFHSKGLAAVAVAKSSIRLHGEHSPFLRNVISR